MISLAILAATGWVSAAQPNRPNVLLAGYFTSCNDAETGGYGEKVFELAANGKTYAELHMGPRDEFGLFLGTQDEEFDHNGPGNLLAPAWHANDVHTVVGGRNWAIDALNLKLNVVGIGGSDQDCYYYVVQLERGPRRVVAP